MLKAQGDGPLTPEEANYFDRTIRAEIPQGLESLTKFVQDYNRKKWIARTPEPSRQAAIPQCICGNHKARLDY